MASDADKLLILEKINKAKERYNQLQEKSESTGRDYTKSLTRQLGSIKKLGRELKEINSSLQERLDFYKDEEASISNIDSSYQKKLIVSQKEVLSIASSMGSTILPEQREVISDILSISRALADSSVEDVQAQTALRENLDSQLSLAGALLVEHQDILQALESQRDIADGIAHLEEAQINSIKQANELTDLLKDKFGAVLTTLQTLTSGPLGAMGVILGGIGTVANAVGKNVREFGGTMDGAVYSTTLLGTVFDDAVGTAKGLAQEFGGMEDVSFATQLNTNLMATNMGISGDEASKTLGIFSRLNSNSKDTAFNMADSVASMSRASGLDTSQVMGDIAANAESFAEYSQDGGKNMGLAAIQAAKLGVSMGTLTNITDSLLDFETSITKELELGAMLGKNINLNRARGLAYEGKVGASVKETIKQLGGVAEYNKMDIFAKRETAKLLGINQEELSKLVNNMENLNDDGTLQLSTWGSITEAVKAFATGPMGSALQGLGSMVIATGQMNMGLQSFGTSIGGMVKGLGRGLKHLIMYPIYLAKAAAIKIGGMLGIGDGVVGKYGASLADKAKDSIVDKAKDSIKEKATDSIKEKATESITNEANPAGKGGMMESMSKINMSAVLKGAAAMVLVAGAVYILGKALQEYTNVGLGEIGMAAAGMLLLGGAVMALGALIGGPQALLILAGAAAMLVVAASIYVLGKALQEMSIGFSALGQIQPILSSLVGIVGGIGLLSLAFMGLAGSLMFLGTAGIFALPALLGIAAASTGLSMVAGILGIGGESSGGENSAVEKGSLSEYEETMLEKMDSLISAVSANKDVYLDKDKVTSLVMQKSDRSIMNKLNIFNA